MDATIVSVVFLNEKRESGDLVVQESITPGALARIRESSGSSTRMPTDVFDILDDQDLVPI
jgi:hypothetical protein